MSRRGRHLSEEERRLWALVQRSAEALHPEPQPTKEPPAPVAAPEPPKPRKKKAAAAMLPLPATPMLPAPPPGPARLDRRTRSRLGRGALPIEARLDLHGLTREAARRRLRHFLEDAQMEGFRLVLVITGKGAAPENGDFTAPIRGVLRRAVPEWLAGPELRPIVAGFDEAARHHGGGGAIYVRIRKRREG